MSRIAIIGDIHGKVDAMLERALEYKADIVIQVGDFGTYVDERKLDKGTRNHWGLGDFVHYYNHERSFPIPVYFIHGNHEDFDIIQELKVGRIHNLNYLENGNVYSIHGFTFGVLGGNYSPTRFHLDRGDPGLAGNRRKHFNHQDIENLRAQTPPIIISHDCPLGIGMLGKQRKEVGSPEITKLVRDIQPTHLFHGHHHRYKETLLGTTQVISLGILSGTSKDIYLLEN